MKIKVSKKKKNVSKEIAPVPEKLMEPEGLLAVDIFQTDKDFYIQTAVAGVSPDNLDISINQDMLTIKGKREKSQKIGSPEKDYFYEECFWGSFSRQIILPGPVDSSKIEATVEDGILTIKLPKKNEEKKNKRIKIK